jgi:hypothetical protein
MMPQFRLILSFRDWQLQGKCAGKTPPRGISARMRHIIDAAMDERARLTAMVKAAG